MRAPGALWTSLHVLGWALYLGGAATMEVVWRPAQRDIPPGQTAVLCQRMGLRYRWLALSSLVVIAVSGVAGLADLGYLSTSRPFLRPPLVLSSSYGRTMLAGAACWGVLAASVLALTFLIHPALHARTDPSMSEEERREERRKVGRAIRRMNVTLRVDLAVALVATLFGASLRGGGLL